MIHNIFLVNLLYSASKILKHLTGQMNDFYWSKLVH